MREAASWWAYFRISRSAHLVPKRPAVRLDAILAAVRIRRGVGLGPYVETLVLRLGGHD